MKVACPFRMRRIQSYPSTPAKCRQQSLYSPGSERIWIVDMRPAEHFRMMRRLSSIPYSPAQFRRGRPSCTPVQFLSQITSSLKVFELILIVNLCQPCRSSVIGHGVIKLPLSIPIHVVGAVHTAHHNDWFAVKVDCNLPIVFTFYKVIPIQQEQASTVGHTTTVINGTSSS